MITLSKTVVYFLCFKRINAVLMSMCMWPISCDAKYSEFSETSLIMKSVKVSPCGHLDVCRIMYWHFFVGSPYMSALVGPIMLPIIQSKQTLTFITPSLSLKLAVFLAPRRGWLNIKNTTIGMFNGQRFQVAYMRNILKENWFRGLEARQGKFKWLHSFSFFHTKCLKSLTCHLSLCELIKSILHCVPACCLLQW